MAANTDPLRSRLVEIGVPGRAAKALGESYLDLEEILDRSDAQLLNEEGVGPATIDALRDHDDSVTARDLFADGWYESIRAIRANHDDSYAARIEVGADIMRVVEDPPQEVASEAVLQQIIRYQDADPGDVWTLVQKKYDQETALDIRRAIVEYWEESEIEVPA